MRITSTATAHDHPVLAIAFSIVCICTAAARADAPANTLAEPERRSGWRLLFDGQSSDAFRGYWQAAVPTGWVVEEGAIVRKAAGAGDLITKDTFEHFELVLDYRIAPGGNSGVMFHVTETERAPWMTGPEVQILDNQSAREGQKAGWLYQLYAPKKPEWLVDVEVKAGRPRNEWLDATRPGRSERCPKTHCPCSPSRRSPGSPGRVGRP